jgi:hypothetical protein
MPVPKLAEDPEKTQGHAPVLIVDFGRQRLGLSVISTDNRLLPGAKVGGTYRCPPGASTPSIKKMEDFVRFFLFPRTLFRLLR